MSTNADNYFSCKETPANFPSGVKLSAIPESPTSKLRIISKIPGPGNYTGPIDFFFDINENPTASVHFNGFMYNLSKSYLCIPGVHKISRETKVCDAELVIIFNPSQSLTTPQLPIMLCIPVESGIRMNPKSEKYFATLSTSVTANRPTLGSILGPKSTFLAYNGFNFLLRLGNTNALRTCADIPTSPTNIVRYMVCQDAIGMSVYDYERLSGQLARKPRPAGANDYAPLEQLVKPPVCTDEISSARYMLLTTRITNVSIEAGDAFAMDSIVKGSKGVPVNSMTCKPIRPGGSGKGLRVDMTKGGTSLDKELTQTQTDLNNMDLGRIDPGIPDSATTHIEPGDIEKTLGIFFGIVVGLVVCAGLVYLFQSYVFGEHYVSVINFKEGAPVKAADIKPMSVPSIPLIPSGPNIFQKVLCPKD